MAKTFKYRGGSRTVESVVKRSKQSSGLYDSYIDSAVQLFKPKEGENTVRILPSTWEDMEKYGDGWELNVYLHYDIGPDNGAYLCLDKMKGEECPICAARGDAADQDEAKALRPGSRLLCWMIDRDNEKAGPMVWSMPLSLFKDINGRSVDKKSNTPILIDDPEEGFDVVFVREGSGKKTEYTGVEVLREASPIHDDEKLQNRWLTYITENPLPDVLRYYDADHIEKVLFGKVDKSADDDDAEPAPRSRRSLAREEEEEEPAPRFSRRRAVAEEEPEEDAEPAPRSSRRRAATEEEEDNDAPPARSARRRQLLDDDDAEPAPRSSRRRATVEDDDIPFDEGERRPRRGAVEEPEEAEGEPAPVSRAKAALERLKTRGRRS